MLDPLIWITPSLSPAASELIASLFSSFKNNCCLANVFKLAAVTDAPAVKITWRVEGVCLDILTL